MPKIRALIVDDEEGGRHTIRNLLTEYCPQVEIVGLADSPSVAFKMIQLHQPELVFLDIRMPAGDEGFQLLESIDDIQFAVIFTTSYDEYAIRAIKFSALDYLLKPINILELQKAVNRYTKRRGNSDAVAIKNLPKDNQAFQKLGLPSIEGLTFINIAEIIRCEADGNCTIFYIANRKKILVTKTLKYYDELLANSNFHRIHGSHLINLKHIAKYKKEGIVELSDGSEVYVSARKKKTFVEKLSNLKYRI